MISWRSYATIAAARSDLAMGNANWPFRIHRFHIRNRINLSLRPGRFRYVGDAKAAALAYYNSGTYQKDPRNHSWPGVSWINSRAASVKRPALVLDIDETALSNWEILKRDDFGRPISGPCDEAIDAPWLGCVGSPRARSGDRTNAASLSAGPSSGCCGILYHRPTRKPAPRH